MPLSPLQNELLFALNAYLAGEFSLDDFRGWELEQIGRKDLLPEDERTIEHLVLIAETVVSEAAEEGDFAAEARLVAERLEAERVPRVATGARPVETRSKAVSRGSSPSLT